MHPSNFCLPKVRYFLSRATLTIGNRRGKFLFQISYEEGRFKEKELKPFPPNVSFGGNMLKDPVNIAQMRSWPLFEEKKAANMGLPPAASQSGSPFVPLSSRVMHGECTRADDGLRWQRMNANTGSLTRWKEKGRRGSPESTDRMASLPRSQRTWP